MLLASEYTVSIDVWAVGCILCELVNRKPLFAGPDAAAASPPAERPFGGARSLVSTITVLQR